eukprot:97955_1
MSTNIHKSNELINSESFVDNSLAIYQSVVYNNNQLSLSNTSIFQCFEKCNEDNILECKSTKRIKLILEQYNSILNTKHSSISIQNKLHKLINKSLGNGNYSNTQLSSDFLHIKLDHHLQNNNQFHKIHKYLTSTNLMSTECTLKYCQANEIYDNKTDNSSLDLVTTIHTYLFHSHNKNYTHKSTHNEPNTNTKIQNNNKYVEITYLHNNIPYYIRDTKIRAHKMRCNLSVSGFIRNQHIYIPHEITTLIYTFYYRDHVMDLLALHDKPIMQMDKHDIIERLKCCCVPFDFTLNNIDEIYKNAIDAKTHVLETTKDILQDTIGRCKYVLQQTIQTISTNLFRSLPYHVRPYILSIYNNDIPIQNNINYQDASWKHLKLVYSLLWTIINIPAVTAAVIKQYITVKFLGNLVELFASDDYNERQYLMMILHKIYTKCLNLRPVIMDIICCYFYRMIYSDEFTHTNGIKELLQIVCAVIAGLNAPIQDSWRLFATNVLVPLHKCQMLNNFWEQLTQCCVNYVIKDLDGVAVILGGLLKFWPLQCARKEEIFIMEIVNMINVLISHPNGFYYEDHKQILKCVANKLTECLLSGRNPIVQRALVAWKQKCMQTLVDYDRKTFLPKLCEAFYRHKNIFIAHIAVRQQSLNVEKIYKAKDS